MRELPSKPRSMEIVSQYIGLAVPRNYLFFVVDEEKALGVVCYNVMIIITIIIM